MVELQPSKLIMRVRFPLPAPCRTRIFVNMWTDVNMWTNATDASDNRHCLPRWQMKLSAHIAQSVEHFLGKEEVTGSNPVVSTKGRGRTSQSIARLG